MICDNANYRVPTPLDMTFLASVSSRLFDLSCASTLGYRPVSGRKMVSCIFSLARPNEVMTSTDLSRANLREAYFSKGFLRGKLRTTHAPFAQTAHFSGSRAKQFDVLNNILLLVPLMDVYLN
jgi:uncharacterized protein YjbI with pentapeptide repeats